LFVPQLVVVGEHTQVMQDPVPLHILLQVFAYMLRILFPVPEQLLAGQVVVPHVVELEEFRQAAFDPEHPAYWQVKQVGAVTFVCAQQ
jgi:hypothetical protein